MTHSAPARTARTRSILLAVLAAAGAAFTGLAVSQALASSTLPVAPAATRSPDPTGPPAPTGTRQPQRGTAPNSMSHGVPGGAVPAGTTVFDDDVPAVGNLDPALLRAVRAAATEAAAEGVMIKVNSGWRSPEYQERLLREAVHKHGSEQEARRWVATPETSAHVAGEAIDLGPPAAAAWLSEHGARHGLCQIYRNEPWHFELRPEAVRDGCPPMYADPTHDPRLQR